MQGMTRMKPRSLRIPLILTWTALSGAGLVVSAACSSSSEPTSQDASPGKDGAPEDTNKPSDHSATDTRVADATEEPVPSFQCEEITDTAVLFLDATADGNCPDGDMKVPII
jgi:hypothetical protein